LPDFRAIWQYRDLAMLLLWRDLQLRFRQTWFGIGWVVLQPLLNTLMFTIIFGFFIRVPSEGLPYAVFAMAGMVPWGFFGASIGRGSASLVGSAHLITKVYFPRLIIPLTSTLGGVVDLAIGLVVLIVMGLVYRVPLSPGLAALPIMLALLLGLALAVAVWLSALNVLYRDVSNLVPLVMQVWFYATPIVYPASLVPEAWRSLYYLNPMTTIIDGLRWGLAGGAALAAWRIGVALVVVVVALVASAFVFRRIERSFVDVG
jgi:lipopolysaccharide transport system permease protein